MENEKLREAERLVEARDIDELYGLLCQCRELADDEYRELEGEAGPHIEVFTKVSDMYMKLYKLLYK